MRNQLFSDYLDQLGTKEGMAGGGSAAGLVGAMSASLVRMVVEIQKDKKKFESKKDILETILETSQALRAQFENLSEKDAEAFEPVSQAYKLPKNSEQEKVTRLKKIDEALEGAARPPMEMMKRILDVLEMYEELTQMDIKGSIVNDIAVGTLFAKTTIEASHLNVLANAEMLKDTNLKETLEQESQVYLNQGLERAERLMKKSKYYLTHKTWPQTEARGDQE